VPTEFGITHLSGLSLGIDPARGDSTPRARPSGPYFSVGTLGTGLSQIIKSVQSVDAGGVTASRTTAVELTVANVPTDAVIVATPDSLWSTAALNTLGIQSYVSVAAGTVVVALSNNSGNNVTVPTLNWQILAIS
jgi:hypothetical protein